jgi:alpha-N-arabinofuranosidase
MLQGSRLTRNLLHDNHVQDLSFEVDHGPVLVDNNLFLSPQQAQVGLSQGCAFVHNLIAWNLWPTGDSDPRQTPYFKPHSTEMAGFHDNPRGDTRFINNLFTGWTDLRPYEKAALPVTMTGNVFLKGTTPSKLEANPLRKPDFDPGIKVVEKPDGWYLEIALDKSWRAEQSRSLATTETIGKAVVPDQAFESPDGSPLRVSKDYFGKKRNPSNPFPGPFEKIADGRQEIKVWPCP